MSTTTQTPRAVHPQNPFLVQHLKEKLGLATAALAALLLRALLSDGKDDQVKAQENRDKTEEAGQLIFNRLALEESMPKVHLRVFRNPHIKGKDTVKIGFLFPAAVGSADLKTVIEGWGFEWGAKGDTPFGAPEDKGWDGDEIHTYRNAKHALLVKTYRKKPVL